LDDGTTQSYRYEYNAAGKMTKSIDPLGRETVYVYGTGTTPDANPTAGTGIDLLQVKQKNPGSPGGYDLLQSATYNTQHLPLTRTDASGQVTTYTYLPDGRRQTMVSPPRNGPTGVPLTLAERTTTFSYFPDNDPPERRKRLQTFAGPSTPQGSATMAYTYDSFGRVRTTTDQESDTLTYDYDALDRMTKTTHSDGTFEETGYNRLDAERRRDRLGRWSHTFHDALRRVASTRDPEGRTVTYEWCTCGSMDRMIDGNGNATSWERDIQGRITKEVRADAAAWEYTYENTITRLKQRKDPLSQITTYTYFKDNNLNQIAYAGEVISTPDVTFTYDPNYNRLTRMEDPATGQTNYGYHPVDTPPALGAGRMATVVGPLSSDAVTYGYDEMGRVASLSLSGSTSFFRYDALGRISSRDGVIGTFGYAYDGPTPRPASITYPSGQQTEYLYFPNSGSHRLQEMKHLAPGGALLSKFNYTHDAVGNIRTWQQEAAPSPAKIYEFGNDRADQLTSATLKTTGGSPTVLTSYGYAYDKAGNRTTESIDTAAIQAAYDNRDRLLQQQVGGSLRFVGNLNEPAGVTIAGMPAEVTADNRFAGSTTVTSGTNTVPVLATDPAGNVRTQNYQVTVTGSGGTFTHDGNGNRTGDGTRTFEWDAANRLVAIVNGTHRSEFTYNGQGRRIRQVEKDGAVVTSDRRFVWCSTLICEERDGSGTVVTRQLDRYGFREGGSNYAWTRDHLGSVREVTDVSGAVRARYEYDPFGRRTKISGDKEANFGFAGLYTHLESGMALARRRAFDPQTGRWLSPDPIGLRAGINRYRYVRNNPGRFRDPSGLCEEPEPEKPCRSYLRVYCTGCSCQFWIYWSAACPDDEAHQPEKTGETFARWHWCNGPDDPDWPEQPDGFSDPDPDDPSPPHDPGTFEYDFTFESDPDDPLQGHDPDMVPVPEEPQIRSGPIP
jgi:RHS repeat-associated protein